MVGADAGDLIGNCEPCAVWLRRRLPGAACNGEWRAVIALARRVADGDRTLLTSEKLRFSAAEIVGVPHLRAETVTACGDVSPVKRT